VTHRSREQLVIVSVGILVLTLVLLIAERNASSKVEIDCFDPTERERVREITLIAIDKGLEQAVMHLYSVWQKDPDTDQPKRARVGVVNALNAHARARKFAVAWDPPHCP
jgi:hypothetical protein